MRPWFKFFGRDFRDGVRGVLSLEEAGAYAIVLTLIYETENRLLDDERIICAHLNVDIRIWRRIRRRLIEAGKLDACGGLLTNARATSEITSAELIAEVRRTSGRSGGKQSGEVRANRLKTNDMDEANASNGLLYARALPESDTDITPSLRSGVTRQRSSKTSISQDAKLSAEGRAYAETHGLNGTADAVWEHFRDHHYSKGNRFVDWDAAWRNWVRNQKRFGATKPQRESQADIIDRVFAEQEAKRATQAQ